MMHRCKQVGGAPGFEPVALNPFVLQAVYGTYRQLFDDMEDTVLNRLVTVLLDVN